MKHIWRAVQFIPEYRGRLLGVIGVGTALGAIGAATPQIYKLIVDALTGVLAGRISPADAAQRVGVLIAVFFAVRVAVVILTALQNYQSDELWLDAVSTYRQRVFDNMTRMSIDYFEKTRVGEIMDRFGAIPQITMWFTSLTDGTLASILQTVFILAVLCHKSALVGTIMAAVLAFNLAISQRTVGWSRPYRRGWQALAGRMAGLLAEMVGNIATVRSFGGEPAVKDRYDGTQAEWMVQRGNLHKVLWRSALALNVANAVGLFAAVYIVARGALAGRFSAGDVLLVLTLAQNLINTITPISRQINQMGEIDASAERLVGLLDVPSEVADMEGAIELERIESVVFESVSFSYPGKQALALENVSFTLNAGEQVALVGPSGSGKTTIVKLLMRFYDPSAGRILLNGRDLREYKQRSVRSKLGVVLQDVALFNDSIGENIAFARQSASTDDVRAAARAAYAEDFIDKLSSKYETVVGERGIKLSGGEKQRIAIARAVLKDPELIILDEATSALDSESERAVQRGFEGLLKGRSSLIIAHRLSTVMAADRIVVLREGRVVEWGKHAVLSKQTNGLYAKLLALQTQGAEVGLSV
ncbi:MAG: ABC transporter ATP-binding protein [Myxococcales bacterium]